MEKSIDDTMWCLQQTGAHQESFKPKREGGEEESQKGK